ncbi:MAG: pathogenicity-like protein [Pseudoxanthomonas sp.]
MRQVYTSLRVETVEGVARLLEEAGIEVYLANGRSYHSKRGGQFSYAEPMKPKQQPSVWVKRAEDQPRARELLRSAGLLHSTRPGQGDPLVFAGATAAEDRPQRTLAWRIRAALLIAVAIAVLVTAMRHRNAQEAALPPPAPAQPAVGPALPEPTGKMPGTEEEDDTVRVRISPPPAADRP